VAGSRFSFAANLQSRDGSLGKGALLTNCYVDEKEPGGPFIYRRPGLSTFAIIGTSTSSYVGGGMAALSPPPGLPVPPDTQLFMVRAGIVYKANNPNLPSTNTNWQRWDGVVAGGAPVLGVNDGNLAASIAAYAPITWTTSGTATVASVRISAQNDGTRYWFFGSGNPQYAVDWALLNSITAQPWRIGNGQYGAGKAIPTLSTVGTLANINPFEQTNIVAGTGSNAVIKGQRALYVYNGTSFTQVSSNYPATTVPGLVYLDSTYYVMDPDAIIWNSTGAADDPTTWPADGFLGASAEQDTGVCLAKANQYVVALCRFTVQLFWDAGNPTGSPLSPVQNGVLLIGCASAGSVAQTESTVIWVAQRKGQGSTAHKGRFIAILVGTSYEVISTDDVNRILDADDLAQVTSAVVEIGGHTWYILCLGTSQITLVYDTQTKLWVTWTMLYPASSVGIASLVQVNGLATGTSSGAHSWSDGDPVIITGAGQAGFNGTFNVNVSGSTGFSYPISTTGTTTATGASLAGQGFTEKPLVVVAACGMGNRQVLQDLVGNVYEINGTNAVDGTAGVPINWKMRTANQDGGNNERKFCFSAAMLGDILAGSSQSLLRTTDDDYQTYSAYRRFDLNSVRSNQQRWGNYRRRAWEWRYTGTWAYRHQAVELEVIQGVT